MSRALDPFRFVLIAVAGWMNQHQLKVIDYLREENRVLREQLGGRRLRLNDDQRRRLAAKAKGLGRKILAEVATIVTPETLLAWHRKRASSAILASAAPRGCLRSCASKRTIFCWTSDVRSVQYRLLCGRANNRSWLDLRGTVDTAISTSCI